MKLAVINKEKCKPTLCSFECKKVCPVEKKELDSCVTVGDKAVIDESTCIGCSICVKRCPFGAIDIVNLPSVSGSDMVHRFGVNGFALYGLPLPKEGQIVGFLGRNGIGKSTAVQLLSGQLKPNLGKGGSASLVEIKDFFRGNEISRYFEKLDGLKVSYKPQNLSSLAVTVSVRDLLHQRGDAGEIRRLAEHLGVATILDNKMSELSGGELQKVAILAASLGGEDVFFFDEPLAFLDIEQRLRIADFIKEVGKDKTVLVVEHDLLILDYLTDVLSIFYGGQGSYGFASSVKPSKLAVNAYLQGFLKEENMRIRDKELNFNFSRNASFSGNTVASWPSFSLKFDSGFVLNVDEGKIHENHVVGILGRNGIGKSSFVRALAGELEVEVGGKKQKLDLGLDVSYKSQHLFSDSDELVRDILVRERVSRRLSSTFNLGVLESKRLCDLSGGEVQRLGIARCLAKDADVYLIDEPSAYLDVEDRIAVAKAIKDVMVEREKTAFVIDHDLLLVSYLADSVLNVDGKSGVSGSVGSLCAFDVGVANLLKGLDVTLRKDVDSGRPRINKRGSVLDREQKERGEWVVL